MLRTLPTSANAAEMFAVVILLSHILMYILIDSRLYYSNFLTSLAAVLSP